MFKILIRNWATNVNVVTGSHTIVSAETEVLNIPVSSPDQIWLSSASIKAECNKAESFDFNVDPGSQYYNAFLPHKTWVRVVYDGTTIFWGCVKSVANSTILQKRSIHAEGSYATLNDTPVEGKEEDLQPNITMDGYFHDLINNHNSYIEDNLKKFSIGNIGITLSSESKKRAATGWSTTVSELDKLIDETGGYVRARYNEKYPSNGANCNYFDWTKYYFRDLGDNRPTFKLSRNLIDLSKGTENTEIFTRVIPIGHKTTTSDSKESKFVYLNGSRYIKVKDVPNEVSVDDEFRSAADFTKAEDNYGIIYKTVNFENASTPAQLREYCLDWIKKNYFGIIHNFSVKGIDMHMLGESDAMILVGDCVNVTYPEFDNDGTPHTVTRKVIVKAIQYDLLHPENNTYTLGVPCDAVDFEYGSKAKKKKASKAAATQAEETRTQAGGGTPSTPITWSTVRAWLDYYYRTCTADDIVEWTETRWATWKKQTVAGKETFIVDQNIRDERPRDTFNAYGEFFKTVRTENGEDEQGTMQYTTEKEYVNTNFTRPGSSSTVKGKVIGHYEISNSKLVSVVGKHTGFAASKGGDKTYVAGGHYGVCISADGHAYTFNWDLFNRAYHMYADNGELEHRTFSTYFEIGRVSNGKLSAASQEAADQGNASQSATNPVGPVTYRNYNGDITVAVSAEGIVSTGFIKGDDGNPVATIVLNEPVTYTDADGNEKTKYVLSVDDLNLPEIPSFRTKIGYIENLFADKAAVKELRAAFAAFGVEYGTESYEFDADGNPVLDEKGNWKLKEGTSFYTTAHTIGAAAGAYYVKEYFDENGQLVRDVIMKEGGGYKVTKDGAEYGLYDEQNLTGGIIVDKINGKQIGEDEEGHPIYDTKTRNKIIGDMVVIGDETATQKITAQEKAVLEAGKQITRLDADVFESNTRITTAEAKLASQGVKIAALDYDVVALNTHLEGFELDVAKEKKKIMKLQEDVLLVNTTLNEHEKNLALKDKKIAKFEDDVFTINASLNEHEAALAANNRKVTKIGSDVVVIGGDLTKAQKDIADTKESITVINSELTWVKKLKADHIETDGADISFGNIKNIYAKYIGINGTASDGASLSAAGNIFTFGDYKIYKAGGTRTLKVIDVQPSGNNLIITYTDGTQKTFSKATSLVNGGWSGSTSSGRTLTINATQTNSGKATVVASFTVGFSGNPNVKIGVKTNVTSTIKPTAVSGNNKWLNYPVAVYDDTPSGVTNVYEKTLQIDGSIVYNAGWSTAYSKVSLPTSSSTADNFTVYTPPQTVDGNANSTKYTIANGDNNNTAVVKNPSGTVVARLLHNKYNAGWAAAYGKVSLPSSGTATSFTVKTPPATVGGDANTNTYTISNGDNNNTAVVKNSSGTVVASLSHNKYNAGWAAAYGKVSLPSGGTATSFTVKTPSATVGGDAKSNTYTISNLTNNVAVVSNSSGTVVASLEHNKYVAGAKSVTLGDFVWSNSDQVVQANTWEPTLRGVTITASNNKTKTLYLYLDQQSLWDSDHCKRVYVMTDGWNGTKYMMMKVDASSVYSSGKQDGTHTTPRYNSVDGLTRYGNSSAQMYIKVGSNYYPVPDNYAHYWYYKDSNSSLNTFYT